MRPLPVITGMTVAALMAAAGVVYGISDHLSPVVGSLSSILGASLLGHVSNNLALADLPVRLGRVRRDGFATTGDGGSAEYTLSQKACAVPDGGTQIALVDGGCAIADGTTRLTPALFGGSFPKLVAAAMALNKPALIPCGTYSNLPALPITVPDNRTFVLRGESRECVILGFSGEGVVATFLGIYSAVDIENLTFITAHTGGRHTALRFQQSLVNPNPALSATSYVSQVTFRGASAVAEPFPYWTNGFVDTGVSNINLDNLTFGGDGSGHGKGLLVEGYKPNATNPEQDGYAVSINVTNYISFGCDTGIIRGDMVQGLSVTNGQATGCHYGVAIPGNTIGQNDQVHIKGGQWADDRYGVLCIDPRTAHMIIEGGYYISVGTATGIQSCGEIPIVSHNTIGGNGSPGSIAINVAYPSPGNNALIEANSIRGVGVGIKESSGITSPVALLNNQISDTKIDYLIHERNRGVLIVDKTPRSFSELRSTASCSKATAGSTYIVSDTKNPKFLEPIVGGGTMTVPTLCRGEDSLFVSY